MSRFCLKQREFTIWQQAYYFTHFGTYKNYEVSISPQLRWPNLVCHYSALEKKAQDDEACGEIETAHPGYLGSQDTFYVGHLKSVGRVYQQTYIDTYSKVVHCKLYTTKSAITAADLLNDKVLPFYSQHGLPVLRILTDRGCEYCGKVEHHDYQLYLAIKLIIQKLKLVHLKLMGFVNAFIKLYYKSSIRWLFVRKSIGL